jgi:hypothetical protein
VTASSFVDTYKLFGRNCVFIIHDFIFQKTLTVTLFLMFIKCVDWNHRQHKYNYEEVALLDTCP